MRSIHPARRPDKEKEQRGKNTTKKRRTERRAKKTKEERGERARRIELPS
jgi:hypothetical protein